MPRNQPIYSSGDWFDENAGALDELAGNISDTTRFSNYEDALQDLQKYKADEDKLKRIGDIRQKLLTADVTQIPKMKDVEGMSLNSDYFAMLPEDEFPKEMHDYSSYVDFLKKESPDKTPVSFDEYLATLGKKDVFTQTHPGAYKKGMQQVPMTEAELEQAYYDMAGLKPEDVEFYNQYKDKLNTKSYNKSLDEFMLNYGPQLRSTGPRGNSYEVELSNRLKGMYANEQPPTKYEWKLDEKSGNLIYVNPTNPNDRKVVKYSDNEKPPTTKEWKIFEDKDGKPYYGERVFKDGKWTIEYRDELNEKELEDYNVSIEKRDGTGRFTKTKSVRRYRGSGTKKSIDFGKMKPEDIAKIKVSDLDNYSLDELESLDEFKNFLSADVKLALKEKSKGQRNKTGDLSSEDYKNYNWGDKENYDEGEESRDDGDDSYMEQFIDTLEDDEKSAFQNVDKWFKNVTGPNGWGRSNLTPDEWRDEIFQEQWSDAEYVIIRELFKERTGEDL